MRAAVLEQVGAPLVVHDDVVAEEPHVGEVAVRVTHCGVCHSDLSLADGALPVDVRVVLGHEAAGVVEATGPGVSRLVAGDHVVLTPCPPCGHCPWCVRGQWSLCANSDALMTSTHPDGGTRLSRGGEVVYRGVGVAAFAETVIIQETGAVKVPDDMALDVACVIGCAVQTGVGAVLNTAGVAEGDTVLVMANVRVASDAGLGEATVGPVAVLHPSPDPAPAAAGRVVGGLHRDVHTTGAVTGHLQDPHPVQSDQHLGPSRTVQPHGGSPL